VTNNLTRRIWEHQHGKIDGFTKKYHLHILVYHETFHDIRDALARETEIKGWVRRKKNELVATKNPKWIDFTPTLREP
jgi:putative endonuclease